MTRTKTVVLGIGNTLFADDGAGVHALRHLSERDADDLECIDAGTLSFTLAAVIEDATQLIVLDAARMGEAPGTVRVYEGEDMDQFLTRHRRLSVHEVSLIDVLSIARLTGALPARRALIGIEPQELGWGERPSEAVQPAIAHAAEAARTLARRWRGATPTTQEAPA